MPTPHRYRFLILWQSLVVESYRSFFAHLMRLADAPTTLVAPDKFRELGGQDVPCAPFTAPFDGTDPRGTATVLHCVSPHVQIALFAGLRRTIARFFQSVSGRPVFVCIAEPYSVTALAAWICACTVSAFRAQKTLFLTYSAQNIKKKLPLPLAMIQTFLFKRSDAILVCGHGQEAVLREHGFNGRIIYFPLWYDSTRFFRIDPAVAEQKLTSALGTNLFPIAQNGARPVRIGYCGSISAEKGVPDLLKAFRTPDIESQARLFFAGDGPLKERVASAGDSVHYCGRLNPDDTAAFMNAMDILVVPSRTTPHWKEQFGRVIVEAMACGVVVIGSDSGEIPHVIADDSRIFREQDPVDLSRALSHWVAAAALPAFAQARASSVAKAKAYTDDACARRFFEAFSNQSGAH